MPHGFSFVAGISTTSSMKRKKNTKHMCGHGQRINLRWQFEYIPMFRLSFACLRHERAKIIKLNDTELPSTGPVSYLLAMNLKLESAIIVFM